MLKRGNKASFMPNSYVFPGGILESSDFNFPKKKTNYELIQTNENSKPFKNDFSLRVAAIRELFEETGLLLIYDEKSQNNIINISDDSELKKWRLKVRENSNKFSDLFYGNNRMDVKSLIPWSSWLTPLKFNNTKRFETVFYVVLTSDSPSINFCENEMCSAIWEQPFNIIKASSEKALVSLPPPQFYELLRLRLAICSKKTSFKNLFNFKRIDSQFIKAEDDPSLISIVMDGDYLYIKSSKNMPSEFIKPRILNSQIILDINNAKPIHRINCRTGIGNPPIEYCYQELHLKNINAAHLFCFIKIIET